MYVDTTLFLHNAKDKTFFTEASDLGEKWDGGKSDVFLQSTKSGMTVCFQRIGITMYGEGEDAEVGSWDYALSHASGRAFPHLIGYKLIIWND